MVNLIPGKCKWSQLDDKPLEKQWENPNSASQTTHSHPYGTWRGEGLTLWCDWGDSV